MSTSDKFTGKNEPTWCPGCGDYGILMALKMALEKANAVPENTLIVFGIGCSGNMSNWVNTYGFHGLHGRPLPVATGAKLANHDLLVIAEGGDGDGYGIGISHFIHACRRNIDITYIVHNNQIYGLTTGQTSPTSEKGFISQSTPHGSIEMPINPLALAITSGATYVARGYAGHVRHLAELIAQGIAHKGFALIDVLQPCFTFNHVNTYDFFKKRVYKLEDHGYTPTNRQKALLKTLEWGEKIPIGLFYKEHRKTYGDELPQIAKKPLVKQNIARKNVKPLMKKLV